MPVASPTHRTDGPVRTVEPGQAVRPEVQAAPKVGPFRKIGILLDKVDAGVDRAEDRVETAMMKALKAVTTPRYAVPIGAGTAVAGFVAKEGILWAGREAFSYYVGHLSATGSDSFTFINPTGPSDPLLVAGALAFIGAAIAAEAAAWIGVAVAAAGSVRWAGEKVLAFFGWTPEEKKA